MNGTPALVVMAFGLALSWGLFGWGLLRKREREGVNPKG